jgi:hypothetical protein
MGSKFIPTHILRNGVKVINGKPNSWPHPMKFLEISQINSKIKRFCFYFDALKWLAPMSSNVPDKVEQIVSLFDVNR